MPIRYISVPSQSVILCDPFTKEPVKTFEGKPEDEINFEQFLGRLMFNPLWGASFQAFKAQLAILMAWEKAKTEREVGRVLVLSEEDWKLLKESAEKPNPAGYGYHPALLWGFIPFATAIIEATTTDPKSTLLTPVNQELPK